MIYIYTHSITNRLKFTLDVLLKNILQVAYKIVDKETFIENSKYPKINYSEEELIADIWIKPHTLLFETDIITQDIAVTHQKDIPYFFKTADGGEFKFDIFASSFYMISRYEEYLPFNADIYDRFPAKESLAYKANFLHKPVVHIWAKGLQNAILKKKPSFLFPTRIFTQVNTIDVDVAYSYKGKPLFRRLGGCIKALFRFDFNDIKNRISYVFNGKDPYDTYKTIIEIQEESNATHRYFFQVGYRGAYDKNIPLNKVMKQLITSVSEYAEIGLHPSFASNYSITLLEKEYKDLSIVNGGPITSSRQHYLKISFPETYENLISVGVKNDFTLAFPDQIGFRAGMALPFQFFNLQTNEQRPLNIVPFQIMDGTLKDYMQLTSAEAIEQIRMIKDEVKAVHGQFVSLFHNTTLTDVGDWHGWLTVYKEVLIV